MVAAAAVASETAYGNHTSADHDNTSRPMLLRPLSQEMESNQTKPMVNGRDGYDLRYQQPTPYDENIMHKVIIIYIAVYENMCTVFGRYRLAHIGI